MEEPRGARLHKRGLPREGVMRRTLLVLCAFAVVVFTANGCGGQTDKAASGASSGDRAAVVKYSSDVAPGFKVYIDMTLTNKKAQQALKVAKDRNRFLDEFDRFVVEIRLAAKKLGAVTPPASLSTAHASWIDGLNQMSISADRFRDAYKKYVRTPAPTAATKAKIRKLWNKFADDGIVQAQAMGTWITTLGQEADAMNIPEAQWLKDGVSRMQQSL